MKSSLRALPIGLVLVAVAALRSSAVVMLPTYGPAQPQFQPPHVQNGLLMITAVGDFNCDDRADVVLVRGIFGTNTLVPVTIALADGSGGFVDGTAAIFAGSVPAVMWPRKILVDDFNGDGRPDVFIADHGNDSPSGGFAGYQNTLLLSTGSCQLANATAGLPQQFDFTHSAASADIDNDGDVDLFVGNIWNATLVPPQIWLNDGTGSFAHAAGRLPAAQLDLTQNRYTASLFVDVNGDDNPDLVLGGQNESQTQSIVLLNNGQGRFSPLPNAMPAKPFGADAIALDIKAADFNHDGRHDLVVVFTKATYQGRWAQILINNGNGTFTDHTAAALPQVDNASPWDIWAHLVDFDGDGNHDLIAESVDFSAGNRHYTASASGQFSNVPFLSGLFSGLFAMVDADADGHRDVLTIGFNQLGQEQASLLRNTSAVLPPGIPLGVRASRGLSGHVRVVWPYVWGATSYEVSRSAAQGSPGSLLTTVTSTTFDDVTATPGMSWYYRIRAVNGAGTSGHSLVTAGNAVQELVQNGDFGLGTTGWIVYGAPTPAEIQASVTSGVIEFTRGLTSGNQAAVFQETGTSLAANTALSAQFDIGNSSLVRKRISVLIIDSDFSDLSVCTFWLEPQTTLRTYTMRTHTTKPWTNAAIYFYAASQGPNGGAYRLDKVSLHVDLGGSINSTECGDPTAPEPSVAPDGPEFLVNGDFSNGLTGWSTFYNIVYAANATSFYFYRPVQSSLPAGGILQPAHTAVGARTILTARFVLANTSAVRKRVTVLMHEWDFSDLSACTFWVPPGQAMSPPNEYVMRTFTTKAWTNAYLSFYAATVDDEPWTGLDNVTWHTTPGTPTIGTDCGEPGSGLAPVPSPLASLPLVDFFARPRFSSVASGTDLRSLTVTTR